MLYGPAAKAEGAKGTRDGTVAKGVGWVVGLAVLAAIAYALASTGSLKAAWQKVGRHASEMTGGLAGKRPDAEKDRRSDRS